MTGGILNLAVVSRKEGRRYVYGASSCRVDARWSRCRGRSSHVPVVSEVFPAGLEKPADEAEQAQLLVLNHPRYAEEEAQGLHGKGGKGKKGRWQWRREGGGQGRRAEAIRRGGVSSKFHQAAVPDELPTDTSQVCGEVSI